MEFWRYGIHGDSFNSQSYKVHPKRRQESKTARRKIRERIAELGYDPDIWTLEELENFGSELDDEVWASLRDDTVLSELLHKARVRFQGGKNFHSPPSRRGMYAFPAGFKEMFIVCWKNIGQEEKFLRKSVIDYRKPSLWCHFEGVAESTPEVTILERKGSWIRVSLQEYKTLLKKQVKADIRELKRNWESPPMVGRHNLGRFTDLSHYEVFLP